MGTQCPVPGLPYQVRNRMIERKKSQADILGSGDSSHGGVVYLQFNQFRKGRSIKSWGKKVDCVRSLKDVNAWSLLQSFEIRCCLVSGYSVPAMVQLNTKLR